MRNFKLLISLVAVFALSTSTSAWSANIIVVNGDPADVGFNDPTPVDPVGGNPGTTLGEQRLFVFDIAAQAWGDELQSTVDIYLLALFSPLFCEPTLAVLGSAGPQTVNANFPGAELENVWYYGALADSLSGEDLDPAFFDMVAQFNGDIGVNPDCLTGQSWYNGVDHQNDSNTEIDLLSVVMHELAHGLGFLEIVSRVTGELFFGIPDVYSYNMMDATQGLTWPELTDAERLASQVNTDNLVWVGDAVTDEASNVLGPRPSVQYWASKHRSGSVEAQIASFGRPITAKGGVTGKMVIANDGDGGAGVSTDGCEPLINKVRGKVVLIDRGACSFTQKVANAQAARAKAVIIVNNQPKGRPPMGGSDPDVRIPSVGVSMDDGNFFKEAASGHSKIVGKLILDKKFLAGANPDNFVRLYAPDPVSPGSSKSHFDTSANPNLLMEPFINDDLVPIIFLDLTPQLMQDIGWVLQ